MYIKNKCIWIYRNFQNFIIEVVKKLSKAATRTDIETAQLKLAFSDSQKFIYENSSLNTLSFYGQASVKKLRKHCLNNISSEGSLFEFGVFKGSSLNFFADILEKKNDKRIIIGFDSWKGFSEEWSGINNLYKVRTFDLRGGQPKVKKNTFLVDGFIEKTLPNYIEKNKIDSIAFIHIDTDTYTPAKVVLTSLKPFFKSGTIILFDEFCGYPNWRSHEYKALTEVLGPSEYEFLGFAQWSQRDLIHSGNRALLIKAAIRII